MMTAIETTGTVNEQHQLVLDESLPLQANERVKVIILSDKQEPQTAVRRKAGSAAGLIKIADDFNAPLKDFSEYMP